MNLSTLILAAGLGKRMNSDLPKVLHPVHGKPMVTYCIDLSKEFGAEKTILIVGYKKELVMHATRDFDVEYVTQEPQLGTGHAVMVTEEALRSFEGNILVLYGDVPLLSTATLQKMIDIHQTTGAVATILTAELDDPTGYGRIIRDQEGYVVKIVEQKDATVEERDVKEINSGIYLFKKPELFEALKKITCSPVTREYYLTSVFDLFSQQGLKVCGVIAENSNEILGVNTPEQLAAIESTVQK
jgi:UDP-N-acetylglucosamine pyrophosphorylase